MPALIKPAMNLLPEVLHRKRLHLNQFRLVLRSVVMILVLVAVEKNSRPAMVVTQSKRTSSK
jgi:hypothetical protein